ncbi:hypothetical protein [Endozoicomonas sp. 4G]|uniref:hypothetical protein n=1 Tax=Endozoicomonas sp. 4G TaxID=2872754 RepID=UPI00207908AF|nr:hypothetical protein [Endozoicomonas sp. 4G]
MSSSHTSLAYSTVSTADLSDNCPPPEGTPLFQAYDSKNQRIYVLIQPESHNKKPSKTIILARYKGSELDKEFGRCGIVIYKYSVIYNGILDAYQSLVGQVVHETTGSHLDIIVTTPSGKTTLFAFPLTATQIDRAEFSVHNNAFPENIQINGTAHHQGAMYLTGAIDNSLFIGRYHQRGLFLTKEHPENSASGEKQQGVILRLSPDGKHFYVTSKSGADALYPSFIRQYDSRQLSLMASFGSSYADDLDTLNNQQDILAQTDQVYVALFNPTDEMLSIRRFATGNRLMDSTFIIDEKINLPSQTPDSFATIRLMKTGDYLHAIIYNRAGQLSVFTYDDQVNINRFDATFTAATAKSMRPVFAGNNLYLAFTNPDIGEHRRQVQMQEVSLNLEHYNHTKPTATLSNRKALALSSRIIPDWGLAFLSGSATLVVVALVVTVSVYCYSKKQIASRKQTLKAPPKAP